MKSKIGFIGYGNMASAMVKGLSISRYFNMTNVYVTDIDEEKKLAARKETGAAIQYSGKELAEFVDFLVLAVKPHQYKAVIDEIKDKLSPTTVIISIAAGLTIKTLESYFEKPVKLVRAMPNTPAMVGTGMTALALNMKMSEAALRKLKSIFNAFGQLEIIDESLMDAAIVTSGSAPAYIYMMIEAMITGGMREGMTREVATTFTVQAVLGAAKMVRETGKNPNDLRDAVCSPNGTTIEAVNYLNDHHFGEIVQNAMNACAEKSREMSKN